MTLVYTANDLKKNDLSLCKLDINIGTKQQLLVASAALNLRRNSLKENVLLYCKFYFENQVWYGVDTQKQLISSKFHLYKYI